MISTLIYTMFKKLCSIISSNEQSNINFLVRVFIMEGKAYLGADI